MKTMEKYLNKNNEERDNLAANIYYNIDNYILKSFERITEEKAFDDMNRLSKFAISNLENNKVKLFFIRSQFNFFIKNDIDKEMRKELIKIILKEINCVINAYKFNFVFEREERLKESEKVLYYNVNSNLGRLIESL